MTEQQTRQEVVALGRDILDTLKTLRETEQRVYQMGWALEQRLKEWIAAREQSPR